MICLVTQMSVYMCTKAYTSVYIQGVQAYSVLHRCVQMLSVPTTWFPAVHTR